MNSACQQAMRCWWEDGHPGWMIFTLGNQHFERLDDIIAVRAAMHLKPLAISHGSESMSNLRTIPLRPMHCSCQHMATTEPDPSVQVSQKHLLGHGVRMVFVWSWRGANRRSPVRASLMQC